MAATVKICGLDRAESVDAAVAAGADLVGFVFFPRSPRDIAVEAAAALVARVPEHVVRVGLVVDPDDPTLDRILRDVPLDMVQLHGREPPERAAEIRARTGLGVMKALAVGGADDLAAAARYDGAVDRLLLDARPPADSDRPGGNAAAFDWTLLEAGPRPTVPWLLAGGITPDNVATALRISGAPGVDVSSGVEDAPGHKDPALIRRLIAAARAGG